MGGVDIAMSRKTIGIPDNGTGRLPGKQKCLGGLAVFVLVAGLLAGCGPAGPNDRGRLSQRGYLWQREWTPAVVEAVRHADQKMDGLVILGAEVHWKGGAPEIIRSTVSWDALKSRGKPCALALRIAPFPGPFTANDAPALAVKGAGASLLREARIHGVAVHEFQVDFDCAQKKLAGYRVWLNALRPVVGSVPLVITTLPAWLDEPEFRRLLDEADGYVLQVHSVPTEQETGHAALCDPDLALKWVGKAAKLGRPFSVALPTYWCLAGYGPSGKLLGVSMDSVQPSWPEGTRVLEFSTGADVVAGLVRTWQSKRPKQMKELLWYRVPVSTDARNWRWPTLSAVMEGREPAHRIEPVAEGGNPVDLALTNSGEAEETLDRPVMVIWTEGELVASDAQPGWTVQVEKGRAMFLPEPGRRLRLSPGGRRGIGWLRYDTNTKVRCQMAELKKKAPWFFSRGIGNRRDLLRIGVLWPLGIFFLE